MAMIPDLVGYWLSGVDRGRGDERLDHGAVRSRAPGVGRRGDRRPGPAPLAVRRPGAAGQSARPDPRCGGSRHGRRTGRRRLARRVARHGVRGRRRPRRRWRVCVRRLRDMGPRRGRDRRADPDGGEPPRQLHQRGGRRRPYPLPSQRDGPVAAPGVAPFVGRGGRSGRPRRPAGGRGGAPGRRAAYRAQRPRLPGAGRHAGEDRGRLPQGRHAPAVEPARARPVHPRQPGGGIRHGRRRCRAPVGADRPGCPPGRWRRPQSAAVPAHRAGVRQAGHRRAGRGDGDREPVGPGSGARKHHRGPRRRFEP